MRNYSPIRAVAKPQDPIGMERGLQVPLDSEEGWKGFDVYSSPCVIEASNDPFTPEDIDAMKVCDRDFYGGCIDDIADFNTTGLFQLGVPFDYELHYQIGANFTKTLAALEAGMLEHIASLVGLNKCEQGRNLRNRRLRARQLQLLSESELSRFDGVSSLPLDRKDPYWDACTVPVANEIAKASMCDPVNGYITFYLDNDPELTTAEQASIRSGILRVVRSGMGNDVYVTGNVNQVVFVGTRAVDGNIPTAPVAVGNGNEPTSVSKADPGLSGPGKGILGAFGALSLLLLLVVFIRRTRKDEVADEHTAVDDEPVKVDSVRERDLAAFGHYDSGDNIISRGSLADQDTLALADTMALALAARTLHATQPKQFDDVTTPSSVSYNKTQMNPSIATAGTKPDGNVKPIVFAAADADMPVLTMSDGPDAVGGDEGVYDRFDGDIIQCLNTIAEDESEDGMLLLQDDDLDGDEDSRTH